jgi:hypothetical protein
LCYSIINCPATNFGIKDGGGEGNDAFFKKVMFEEGRGE